MLVFKIISTVILGIICFLGFLVNCAVVSGRHEIRDVVITTGILWSLIAFVIVTVWIS